MTNPASILRVGADTGVAKRNAYCHTETHFQSKSFDAAGGVANEMAGAVFIVLLIHLKQ